MAIVVESTANAVTTSSTSLTINKPTGLQVGELMVASLTCYDGTSASINVLSGWTQVGQAVSASNCVSIQYKFAEASDVSASNFTFTCSEATLNVGAIIRCSGVSSPVIAGFGTRVDNSTGGNVFTITQSVSPVTDGALFICAFALESSGSGSLDSVTGYSVAGDTLTFTELYDEGLTAVGQPHQAGAYAIQDEKASITSLSATSSRSGLDDCSGIFAVFEAEQNTSVVVSPLSLSSTTPAPALSGDAIIEVAPLSLTSTTPTATGAEEVKPWTGRAKGSGSWTGRNK